MLAREAKMHVDTHARTQGGPAVEAATTPPAYPSGSPLVARDPSPTVVIGIGPATIMKRRPSPLVVRYPSVSVIGHHPMAIRGIGLEALLRVWKPYISIFRVVYPLTVRCEFVVKCLERNAHARLRF